MRSVEQSDLGDSKVDLSKKCGIKVDYVDCCFFSLPSLSLSLSLSFSWSSFHLSMKCQWMQSAAFEFTLLGFLVQVADKGSSHCKEDGISSLSCQDVGRQSPS